MNILKKLTNANLGIASLFVIISTIIIIFVTETDLFMNVISYNEGKELYRMWIKFGLQNLSFFFMGLAGINLLWELYSKRNFADEILEKVNLSTDIKDSGIIKIYRNFQEVSQDEWSDLLKVNIKFAKLFFSSSTLWMRSNLKNLETLNSKKKSIEVYMPNFNNQELLKALALKDNEKENIIKDKIEKTYESFLKLQKNNSKLIIKLVDEIPIMTFYMNEEKIIIATYSLISKNEDVPTFLAKKDGFLYEFANKEIEHLKSSQTL